MLIVIGTFVVDPERRDEFIAERHERMRTSRAEAGCLEYTFAADPLDASRVLLTERWADQAALDAHLGAPAPAGTPKPAVTPKEASIMVYDVTSERPLGR
jgi:quinol monooxygenase YgiN